QGRSIHLRLETMHPRFSTRSNASWDGCTRLGMSIDPQEFGKIMHFGGMFLGTEATQKRLTSSCGLMCLIVANATSSLISDQLLLTVRMKERKKSFHVPIAQPI